MKKAVIFDLDGTLWDATHQILPAWNRSMAKHNTGLVMNHDHMCSCMGKTTVEIAEMLLPHIPTDAGADIVDDCCREEIADLLQTGGTLYPELRETLLKLKEKYHLFIVSNCQDGYIQAFLTYHKFWDLIEDFECIGVTGKCKGDNIHLVMERNGIDKALYVGDTLSDYKATLIAGVPFVHANYGFGKVDDARQLERFSDICAVAEEVLG